MPTVELITGPVDRLERELADRVRSAQADAPLRPVHVLVGTTLLRPYLRRRLARLLGGVAGAHLLTVGELGLHLGEAELLREGRRPLPFLADRVLAAEVTRQAPGAFAPVAELPGFSAVLTRTLRDLRVAGIEPEQLAAAAQSEDPTDADARRLGSLAELYRLSAALRASRFGPEDALAAADPSRLGATGLIVYGIWDTTAVLRDAMERIASHAPLTILTPRAEGPSDDALRPLWQFAIDRLEARRTDLPLGTGGDDLAAVQHTAFLPPAGERKPGDGSVAVVSAPDPAREVRQVVRQCLRWADDGIPFHEIALAYRDGSTYRPLLEAALREAEIPSYAHEGTPLSERPVGRRVRAILDLADATDSDGHPRLDRAAVLEFLADARLPDETYERYGRPSVPRWEAITRAAGVVAGRTQWSDRLRTYADALEATNGDAPQWKLDRQASARHLAAFVDDLATGLMARPDGAPWTAHVGWLTGLLERYVADAGPVLGAVAELGELDAITGATDAAAFAAAVTALLEGMRDRDALGAQQGAFGLRGVNVLAVDSLRQLTFRAVGVVGLAERVFPPAPREDPLLLDDRREELNARFGFDLGLRARGRDPEPLQFHGALAAARERLLLAYARTGSDGRGQLPSPFLRAALQALSGRRVTVEDIELGAVSCVSRVPSGRLGPARPDDALTARERRRTMLEDRVPGAVALVRHRLPRSAAGARARDARLRRDCTSFDGVLSGEAVRTLHGLRRFGRPLSASALETYAACPHRHLLQNVLGLREVEDPESIVRVSPLDKGDAIHRILERFMRERPGGPLDATFEHARLRAVAEPVLDALEADGRTGYPLLWRVDRTQILEDLDRWLEHSLAREAERPAYSHYGYEVRFGPARRQMAGEDDPLTRDDALVIELADGRRVDLTGFVDRVDHFGPGSRRFDVVDYKSGRMYGLRTDALTGGEHLQLPLYVLAIARALGVPPEQGAARYVSVDRKAAFKEVSFDGALLAGDPSDFVSLLDELVRTREDGDFHREPGDACRFCSVKGACDVRRQQLHRRKSEDPHIRAVVERKERYP